MNCTDYLKYLNTPDKGTLRSFSKVEKLAQKAISSDIVARKFVGEITTLLHEACDKDTLTFVSKVFFPNQLMIRKTNDHRHYVFSQFKKAKHVKNLKNKQVALVNVYRNVVADLFDPYLAMLIASIQIKENNFQSLEIANLEHKEINKYQFISKRLKGSQLLKGYFPIIRNAVSHSGSDSIEYEGDIIIFKSVKRGAQPGISEIKKSTTKELVGFIQDLVDFVMSLDVSVNIMGLDLMEIIAKEPELCRDFQPLLTPKQLASRRKKNDILYSKIWHDTSLSRLDKLEHFTRKYADGARKNTMPAKSLRFHENFVIIEVPRGALKGTANVFLVNRAIELVNYALLAEMYFHFEFSDYLVEETKEATLQSLQFWLKAEDLKLYSIGEAHILDLLHDGKLYRNFQEQPVLIDFEQLDEVALRSLKQQRKRKKR